MCAHGTLDDDYDSFNRNFYRRVGLEEMQHEREGTSNQETIEQELEVYL